MRLPGRPDKISSTSQSPIPGLSLSLPLSLFFETYLPRQVSGLRSHSSDPHGSVGVPIHPTGIVAVLLLHHRLPGTYLTFGAGRSLLKVLQLVKLREFRLRCQALLGKHSRATKTLPSLVTRKWDFKHPVLQSPGSRETRVSLYVSRSRGVQHFARRTGLPTQKLSKKTKISH